MVIDIYYFWGNSTTDIGKMTQDEYGCSQVLIAIDPRKFNIPEITDSMVNNVIYAIKASELAKEWVKISYPGDRVISDCNLSDRTVRRAMDDLLKGGFVNLSRQKSRASKKA